MTDIALPSNWNLSLNTHLHLVLRLAHLSDEVRQQSKGAIWASDDRVHSGQGWVRRWGLELNDEEREAHWVDGAER
jgi:hypothetical protein